MDSSNLDTCGSVSQVIEQLPQPNRTSRYTVFEGVYLSVLSNLFFYLYLLPDPKDKRINLFLVD